jgi:tRNA dimethylallyltransferase
LKAGFFFFVAQLRFLILAGPTASGKSELAVKIAQLLDTEIVGADAYQIYQGFNVLSGKPHSAVLAQVPHHLIGVFPPTEHGDAARYAELAGAVMDNLNQRGKVPLVVGGTGFYLKALTHPLPDLPVVDPKLRAQLASIPLTSLLQQLRSLDPVAYEQVDRQNRRRVSRAVEVCRQTGRPFSSFRATISAAQFTALWLNWPKEELNARIDARVDRMLASGAIEEVGTAGPLGPTASQMIGIAEIRQYLRSELTLEQCAAAMKLATRQFAKRQLTWFRAQPYQPISPDLPLSEIVERYGFKPGGER